MGAEDVGRHLLGWVWSNKVEVLEKLKSIYGWFRGAEKEESERPGILILGGGGVGKSSLGKLLSGNYDFLLDSGSGYKASIGVENYTLKDDPQVEIVVPPGQQHRRAATWGDLHAAIAGGKYRGIVLISAFGFHTIGQIYIKDHRLYKGNKEDFIKSFIQDRREEEVRILKQLIPHLVANSGKLWIFSLVTKQDLWWPKRSEVERHYREGEYAIEIDNLLRSTAQRGFRHELEFVSLVISNFVTAHGEKLRPNAEGYDHALQASSLRRLYETVDGLKRWEEAK